MIDSTAPAVMPEETGEDSMRNTFLVFFLDGQEFAIAIKYVTDIINVQPITPVPSVPGYVKGITNLRGKVIPIVDVRVRFGKASQEYNERTCIIVVEVQDISVGLIIDQVTETVTMLDEDISPPPAFNTGPEARFIQGIAKVGKSIKLILDCKAVLYDIAPEVQDKGQ